MAEIRRLVRGESDRLRIGYLASAMQEYFGPALAKLRRAYPERGDGSDRRKASHLGFIHRMAKRENF